MNKKLKASLSMFLSAAIATTTLPVVASAETDYTASALETVASADPIGKASETVAVELPKPAAHPVISVEQQAIPSAGVTATSGTATIKITSDGVLTISGKAMENFANASAASYAPWYPYLDSITEIVVSDGITSIGDYAFDGFTSLKKITLGKDVSYIGQYAFYGCTALSELNINSTKLETIGGYAFYNCTPIKSLDIPETVAALGDYAFYGCKNITEVTIPSSIGANLGEGTFYGCSALKTVIVQDGITDIKAATFADCSAMEKLVIPTTGLTSIGNNAFYGCANLSTINNDSACFNVPTSVTTIGDAAFAGCAAIKKLLISGGVTAIGKQAFMSCAELTDINISGKQATTIGEEAFMSCGKLTGATLDNGNVTLINKKAFYESGIQHIALPEGLLTIGEQAFEGSKLAALKLPASVTTINKKAFYGLTTLTSVELVSEGRVSPLTLNDSVFEKCTALTSLALEGVGIFGAGVFKDCDALTTAEIPSTTTKMGANVFASCDKLVNFTIADGAKAVGNTVVNGSPVKSVIIPASATTNASAFNGHATLESVTANCTQLQVTLFKNCTKLKSVTLNNTEVLAGNVFEGCTSLENITLPSSIKTLGTYIFKGCTALTKLDIPVSINAVPAGICDGCSSLTDVTYGNVTSIQAYAFRGCAALKAALIPDTVVTIATEAFKGCESIPSVAVNNTKATIAASAFEGCSSLTSAKVPAELTTLSDKLFMGCVSLNTFSGATAATTIGISTFQNCAALTGYSIPTTVTSIGNSAFEGCSKLDCALPTGLQKIGQKAFKDCITLGKTAIISLPTYEKYIKLENETFSGCTSLPRISIPDNVTAIGDGVFKNCTSSKFDLMTISQYVKSIGASAFEGCKNLTNVTINSAIDTSCTTLGQKAFADCTALKEITLPTTLTTVNANTFLNCSSLQSITLPASVTTLGTNAFENCTSLAKASIAATQIKTISNALFKNCTSLQTIAIPNTATTIGANAFEGCTSLEEVSIPGTVTGIQANAFDGCTSLEFVVLPVALSVFNNSVFANCTSLETVIYLSPKSPSATSKYFDNGSKELTIYCYEDSAIEKTYAEKNNIPVKYLTGQNGSYIVFLKQPQGVADLDIGDVVEFNVKVASEGTITYEWYYKNPGDKEFVKAQGFTDTFYKATVSEETDGQQVYCIATATSATDSSVKTPIQSDIVYLSTMDTPAPVLSSAKPQAVTITWDAIDGATGYEVYRRASLADELGEPISSTLTETSFTDSSVVVGDTYYYYVKAINSDLSVKSNLSAALEITVPEPLAVPANVKVTNGVGKVNITWEAVEGASSYRIYRADSATGSKKLLKAVTTLSYADTTAVAGKTYYYFVAAYNGTSKLLSDYSAANKITVANSIAAPVISDATATNGAVTITWDKISDASSYRVFRADSATGAKTLLKAVTGTSYTDSTAVMGKTYYYYVRAYHSGTGTLSAYSAGKEVKNTLSAPSITSAKVANGDVTITWDTVSGATSYRIYRADSATGKKTQLKVRTTPNFTDTTAVLGKTYYYFVAAYDANTSTLSDYSAYKAVTVKNTLAAPIITSAKVNDGDVTIAWNTVSGATSYRIYRANSATGTKTQLKVRTTPNFTDTTAEVGKTYYYFVAAYDANSATLSDYSAFEMVTVKNTLAAPVITSATTNDGNVTIAWNTVSGATSYRIYRADSATGAKTQLKVRTTPNFTDTTAVIGKTYYYFVAAYDANSATLSDYSAYKAVTVKNTLAAPTITSANVNNGDVTIAWNTVSGATSYRIYRADSATGKKTQLKVRTTPNFTDTTAEIGKTYYYFVAAYDANSATLSDYSAYKAVTVKDSLAAPYFTSNTSTSGNVTLTWSEVSDATSYRVYRTTTVGQNLKLLKAVTTEKYTDTTAVAGTTYYYYVASYNTNTGVLSGYSNCLKVSVK